MESVANTYQVGGTHYSKAEYQHWDWVCDVNLHYLLACATKYVARWREKNGVEDLQKAIHYVQKAQEREIEPQTDWTDEKTTRTCEFTAQIPISEGSIIWLICSGGYTAAIRGIDILTLTA